MLPEGSIAVDQLWKRFRADRRGALIKDQIRRLRARLRGRDPGWTWALRDITFSVEPGEALGIVGANGSGKTTLLRILSGVMYQNAGRIDVSGRVGALIEVRAGIHPELSGRENIAVYGTLLGLSRRQVQSRFDDIVQFAELEHAIDRQVKHYSSGMQMRLGFAVAAFLEPSILMVDEILAVGDAAFQQRCMERMREVLASGTTLIFVSHDLATVEATCSRTIWLNRGVMKSDGPTREALAAYRGAVEERAAILAPAPETRAFEIRNPEVVGVGGGMPQTQGETEIRFTLAKHVSDNESLAKIFIGVTEGPATPMFVLAHRAEIGTKAGLTEVRCRIANLPLPSGQFYLWMAVWQRQDNVIAWNPVTKFIVQGQMLDPAPRGIVRLSPVHVASQWEVEPSNGDGLMKSPYGERVELRQQ